MPAGPADARAALVASVVIVTRDRREALAAALGALERQRLAGSARFEVLVVDDGSEDGTLEALEARAASAEPASADRAPDDRTLPAIDVIRLPRSRGPGLARNVGARRARGEALVFLDSDCVPLEGWLAALLAPLRDPAVGASGGAEVSDPAEPLLARVIDWSLTSRLTTGGVRGARGLCAGRYRPRTFSMAVRRAVFERLEGFSPFRHGEDIDLSLRIAALGYELVYAADARVHHRRRKTLAAFGAQVFAMGRARATLVRRSARHAEPVYFLPWLAIAACGAAFAALSGPALAPGGAWAGAALLTLSAGYLAIVGGSAGARLRSLASLALAPAVFALQVAAYASGMAVGLVAPYRPDQAP